MKMNNCGEGIGKGKVVCVTGASGYLASWLVKLLLQRGYTVKATLRDPCDPKKTEHLVGLDGAKERLELFKADLMDEGSFDSAVEGCDGVFHTAAPVVSHSLADPQAEVLDPAVNGTLDILKSCAKVSSIRRVVMTSSLATIVFHGKTLSPDAVVDETWYSDPAICKELELWYMLAKILSEQAATKFAKESDIDLVTMHLSFVLGPLLHPAINDSVELILRLIKEGAQPSIGTSYRYVDVRDVAYAHVLAFETPSASGRYSLPGTAAHYSEVLKILHQLYPTLHLNEKYDDDKLVEPAEHVSDEKAKGLGVNFMPLEATIKDTIENLKDKNLFNF